MKPAALATVSREIPADHPAFAGHFPGAPLLPGAALLAEVIEAALSLPTLAQHLGPSPGVASAKFLAPVRPGAVIEIHYAHAAAGLRFEVRAGATLAASGQLSPGVGDDA
jgi:3-hydroxymyristoyl/3-hydroxydecanoyl-(acyl carrier protein) dehydratase